LIHASAEFRVFGGTRIAESVKGGQSEYGVQFTADNRVKGRKETARIDRFTDPFS
jgi:hypothetical protein